MKSLFLAIVVLAAFCGSAQAQRFSNLDGNRLMTICTSRNPQQVESCTAYVDGISDTVSFYQKLRPQDGSKGGALPAYVCVPGATTGVQLRQAVVNYAGKHRDQLSEAASGIVLRALNEAYLCSGEQRRKTE